MLHLMEVPNVDPALPSLRPPHGGQDRHACLAVSDVQPLAAALAATGVAFTQSRSGRAALFFRDPDGNTVEAAEHPGWREA